MALKICFLMFLACIIGWSRGDSAFSPRMSVRALIPGACPTQNVMAGFDYSKFEGAWYLAQSALPNNAGMTCTGATFGHSDQSKSREATYVAKNKDGQRFLVREPQLVTQDPQSPAKLQIQSQALTEFYTILLAGVEITIGPSTPVPSTVTPQWVLDTDYTDYAIIWTCLNMQALTGQNVNSVEAAIWTRSRNGIKPENVAKVNAILSTYNISPNMVAVQHTQTDCEGALPGTKPSSSSNSGSDISWEFASLVLAAFAARIGF